MATRRDTRHETRSYDDRPMFARGGVSAGPILTGVVVAFGAMFLLSAIVGGVIAALGMAETNIGTQEAMNAGIGAGIALVVAQFLSYMWGGYTAGRMSRGAGPVNGLLVPVAAILIALLVAGIAAVLGAQARLNLPFTTGQLPLENDNIVNWGIGIGVASLIAMFVGGILGGLLGARWHSKLERRTMEADGATGEREVVEDRHAAAPADRDDTHRHDHTDGRHDEARVTGEGRQYESDGTYTRRVDEGEDSGTRGGDGGHRTDDKIDLREERSTRNR